MQAATTADKDGFENLKKSHIARWQEIWNSGRIEVDPEENLELSQNMWASFYYLMSSLPDAYRSDSKPFIGLSPGAVYTSQCKK